MPSPVFMATEHAHVLQFSSNWPVWIVARSTQSQRMTRGDWGRVKKHLISNMFRHYRLGGVFLVQLPFAPLDVVLMYLYIVNLQTAKCIYYSKQSLRKVFILFYLYFEIHIDRLHVIYILKFPMHTVDTMLCQVDQNTVLDAMSISI